MNLKVLSLLCFKISYILGARILGVVPFPSYSHQVVFQPLWRELSLRGHQVVTITTDPIDDPTLTNLTEIDVSYSYAPWKKLDLVNISENILTLFRIASNVSVEILASQLRHPQVQRLLNNKNEHFDLLIVEGLWHTMYAFSVRFNCPYIQMTSLDPPTHNYHEMGNPSNPVLNPDFMLPFYGKLNFLERFTSAVFVLFGQYITEWEFDPIADKFIEAEFGKGYPSIYDIRKNASFMFVNTNRLFHEIRPLLPNIIQIGGGTHLRNSKPISKELNKLLDAAEQGCIYFSFGTNVKVGELDQHLIDIFMKTFSEIPYTVLWKCELGELPGKPKNVIMSKWFPQQDIFKHPNIKLFITQGGLQSMEEAIFHYIPMVVIPFIGDQPTNAKKMEAKGFGIGLDFKTLDKDTFKKSIIEVLSNSKYRNKVKEAADLVKDEPMTGLEKAIWWTEYVIRHKGAKHLKSPALDLPFYQYFLLDVIAFCLLVLVLLVAILVGILKLVLKVFRFLKTQAKIKTQ